MQFQVNTMLSLITVNSEARTDSHRWTILTTFTDFCDVQDFKKMFRVNPSKRPLSFYLEPNSKKCYLCNQTLLNEFLRHNGNLLSKICGYR